MCVSIGAPEAQHNHRIALLPDKLGMSLNSTNSYTDTQDQKMIKYSCSSWGGLETEPFSLHL